MSFLNHVTDSGNSSSMGFDHVHAISLSLCQISCEGPSTAFNQADANEQSFYSSFEISV